MIERCAWLWLIISVCCGAVRGAAPAVTLTDQGDNVVLSNGIVSAVLSKKSASISSLKYRGFELCSDIYYSMDGGTDYRRPANCVFTVKTRTPDMIDIGMKRVWKDEPQAFDIDIHYVLRRGDSGLYTYALLDHPADYPDTGYGEWRAVWKLNNDLLEKIYADETRRWLKHNSKDTFEPTEIKEIIKITSGKRAGQFDCKYDYSTSYYDIGTWGHASDVNKVGAFIVLGSQEFFNDGPTKQDLNAATGINHIHFGMNHYNGSTVKLTKGTAWRKMYGPFMFYVNSAPTADACWEDAKAKVKSERAAWPFGWLTDYPDYPSASERGTVSGKFAIKDALKPGVTGANAWIGLAAPPTGGNWQLDSYNYQFWTKTGADGSFTIPHVRPGEYTLYAFSDGAIGEFSKPGIQVSAGAKVSLGELEWKPVHPGKSIAWEIGVPDRTAKEFRHGDDYFHGYVWKNFDKEFANPLEYTIGKSDPAKDWNYAQTRYGESGTAHKWNIHFDLDSAPTGDATLTLAIASAQRAGINVVVNDGKPVIVKPSVQGGNALLRESIHAKYCVEYVTIPAGQLRAGKNTISLWNTDVKLADSHVMYDYLSLELP